MPVVINEFEVVPEAPPAGAAPAAGSEREAAPNPPREEPDVLRLLVQEQWRAERVRAS